LPHDGDKGIRTSSPLTIFFFWSLVWLIYCDTEFEAIVEDFERAESGINHSPNFPYRNLEDYIIGNRFFDVADVLKTLTRIENAPDSSDGEYHLFSKALLRSLVNALLGIVHLDNPL
jgi:RNA polymerase-interacting CarD/CdnL/TRCF family regulator